VTIGNYAGVRVKEHKLVDGKIEKHKFSQTY
jgi:hypothetical protein